MWLRIPPSLPSRSTASTGCVWSREAKRSSTCSTSSRLTHKAGPQGNSLIVGGASFAVCGSATLASAVLGALDAMIVSSCCFACLSTPSLKFFAGWVRCSLPDLELSFRLKASSNTFLGCSSRARFHTSFVDTRMKTFSIASSFVTKCGSSCSNWEPWSSFWKSVPTVQLAQRNLQQSAKL